VPVVRVAIAADHAGFPLKQLIAERLRAEGHDVVDLGTHSTEPVDYPDFADKLGEAVRSGQAERGVLICGSGVGACIAVNKLRGVRAGLCHDTYSAHQGVEHDDMNVLCLGSRVVGPELAAELVRTFLGARYLGEERFERRLEKLRRLEERELSR
jgi:ribose 5-phosphate isomerase B